MSAATLTRTEQKEQALALHAEGVSKAEIARRLGVSGATVQEWIPTAKLAANTELKKQATALRALGLPNKHIATKLGVSRSHVTSLIGPANPPPSHSNGSKAFVLGSAETFEKVRAIAKSLGATTYQGRGAGNGSLAVLLQWIAEGRLKVVPAFQNGASNAHRESSR